MKLTFRARILTVVSLALVLGTAGAVVIARTHLMKSGEDAAVEKARALLISIDSARDIIGSVDRVSPMIKEIVSKYPHGNVPEKEKELLLRRVPILASIAVGEQAAEKSNYVFRVLSDQPRDKSHKMNETERDILLKFEKDRNSKEDVRRSEDDNFLIVSRPIVVRKEQGCLECHGSPQNSPWKNGKDVLGYQMENFQDGDIHAAFSVNLNLAPIAAAASATGNRIMILGGLIGFFSLLGGYLLMRKPMQILVDMSQELNQAGVDISKTSGRLAVVSGSLAVISTKSAESVHSTSGALEALSNAVIRNAADAKLAAEVSRSTHSSAQKGETEMQDLILAMTEIASSSRKIQDIVGVIDEISFQTNILALNAAVEAARAGEQGRGFAVVAEAVRNLAQRSTIAAKDIANLVGESVMSVERGVQVAGSSGAALNDIVDSVRRIVEINNEFAKASAEHASGINSINIAMTHLNESSHQGSKSAQQAEVYSRQMSQQAEGIKKMSIQLVTVVHGSADSMQTRNAHSLPPEEGQGGNSLPPNSGEHQRVA